MLAHPSTHHPSNQSGLQTELLNLSLFTDITVTFFLIFNFYLLAVESVAFSSDAERKSQSDCLKKLLKAHLLISAVTCFFAICVVICFLVFYHTHCLHLIALTSSHQHQLTRTR